MGEVGILNVGAGDTKLVFDDKNPADKIKAARIVKDMLKRGYFLLVQSEEGDYERALDFDEKTCEYIIADFDPTVEEEYEQEAEATPTAKKKKARQKRVPASKTRAVAVSKTSGG